jgi:pimeloyl-ACP methyl ester carboxylesterase
MLRRALSTTAAAAGALLVVPATAPAALRTTDLHLRMTDGTSLAATLWRPPGPTPAAGWPTVVALHGWRGNRASVASVARTIAASGIQVLAYDSRGFGGSGGRSDLAGPTTVGDLRAIVGWLRGGRRVRASPAVAPAARGGAIGLYGRSAGAGQALAAAAGRLRVQAIVAVNPWVDLQSSLDPAGIPKSGFAHGFLSGCHATCTPATRGALEALRQPQTANAALPYLRSRLLAGRLRRISAPTMVVQGVADPLFGVDQGLALYRGLRRGVPRYLYLGHLGHSSGPEPSAEVTLLRARILAFLTAHLAPAEDVPGPLGIELHPTDPYGVVASTALPAASGTAGWRLARAYGAPASGSLLLGSGGSVGLTRVAPSGWLWGRPVLRLRLRARPGLAPLDSFSVQLWRTLDGRRHLVASGAVSLARPLLSSWRLVNVRLSFAADDPPAHSRLTLTIADGVAPASVSYGSSLPAGPPGSGLEIGLRGSSLRLPLARLRPPAPTPPVAVASPNAEPTTSAARAFGGDGFGPEPG